MSVENIEGLLDALDQMDDMSDEQLADQMCQIMKVLYAGLTVDQFMDQIMKPFILQDPESVRSWFEVQREKLLKQYRAAIKAKRRRATITRK